MVEPKRVFLVECQRLFREGLDRLFGQEEDFCVVGEAANCAEAAELVLALRPDLMLLSIKRPRAECSTIVRWLKQALPQMKLVVLVDPQAEEDVNEAIQWNADGYLSKDISFPHLFKHLRDCAQGETVVSHTLAAGVVRRFAALQGEREVESRDGQALTAREKEVLQQLASGYSNKTIAAMLPITERTVKSHIHNVLEKLQLENRVQAATYAIRHQPK